MKKVSQILIAMAIMSLMSCGQLHVVTLYVDTDQIQTTTTDQHSNFGQPAGITNKHFVTNVRNHDKVIWQGLSTTDTLHIVTITAVEHEDGDYLIDQQAAKSKRVLMQNNNQVFRKIRAKLSGEQAFAEEKYSLTFKISNKSDTFKIDPKIRSYK